MATALDTALIPKIKSIIDLYGKSVVFTVHGITEYDPDEGSVVESGSTDYTVKSTPPENYSRNLVDGDMIRENDCRISISASGLSFTPTNGMPVVFDNENWRVVSVATEYTGDDIGLFSMQLRR